MADESEADVKSPPADGMQQLLDEDRSLLFSFLEVQKHEKGLSREAHFVKVMDNLNFPVGNGNGRLRKVTGLDKIDPFIERALQQEREMRAPKKADKSILQKADESPGQLKEGPVLSMDEESPVEDDEDPDVSPSLVEALVHTRKRLQQRITNDASAFLSQLHAKHYPVLILNWAGDKGSRQV